MTLRNQRMLFSEVPIWVGVDELRPGDLIMVYLGRMLGERRVEYAGIYSEPMSGIRGLLGKMDGKVLPLGSLTIFRRKIEKNERIYE